MSRNEQTGDKLPQDKTCNDHRGTTLWSSSLMQSRFFALQGMALAFFVLTTSVLTGCATTSRNLENAEAHFSEAGYEGALQWLTVLESEVLEMTEQERTRYYYLRGMSELRLGKTAEGVHHLSLARAAAALSAEASAGEASAAETTVAAESSPLTAAQSAALNRALEEHRRWSSPLESSSISAADPREE